MDVDDIEELNDNVKLEAVYDDIKDFFPKKNIRNIVENSVNIDTVTNKTVLEQKVLNSLECFSSDERIKVYINKKVICIELKNCYTDLNSFIDFIKVVNKPFYKMKDLVKIRRLGIRYVNQILLEEGSPFNNESFINKNLTTKEMKFFCDDEKSKINRSLSQTNFIYDDYQVIFINGYSNSQFPAKIMKNEYILDIDCFTTFCDLDNIENIIKKMNTDTIAPLFEKSIEDGLRNLMNK